MFFYLMVFVVTFAVIVLLQVFIGQYPLWLAASFGLLYGFMAMLIFVIARRYRMRGR